MTALLVNSDPPINPDGPFTKSQAMALEVAMFAHERMKGKIGPEFLNQQLAKGDGE